MVQEYCIQKILVIQKRSLLCIESTLKDSTLLQSIDKDLSSNSDMIADESH